MMGKLAILGGQKTINHIFPAYRTLGDEEKKAVLQVLDSNSLSGFYGSWTEKFYGGEQVKTFEKKWCDFFRTKHSVSVNSATSGLIAAVGAIGIEPGDQVIVSPWTMSASATAILVWGGIPVFADIDPKTFNLDPKSILKNLTRKTKGIMVPNIFGHPADLDTIMQIAQKNNLKVIEDAAQCPSAQHKGRFAGTIADIGVFSLNYHKHIHTGEGGMCVTNSPELAERMQLIRNHAEAVVGPKEQKNIVNMIGFNFRMGELEAAIGIEQLKKLQSRVRSRIQAAKRLTDGLKNLKGVSTPYIAQDCTHVYYVYPLVLDIKQIGVSRKKIFDALTAEGVTGLMNGYLNIHLAPIYQQKIAQGTSGFPWSLNAEGKNITYQKGICPVAESMHDEKMLGIQICAHEYTPEETTQVITAFQKVWSQLELLN